MLSVPEAFFPIVRLSTKLFVIGDDTQDLLPEMLNALPLMLIGGS